MILTTYPSPGWSSKYGLKTLLGWEKSFIGSTTPTQDARHQQDYFMLSRKTQQMLVTYLLLLDINIWFKSDHLRYVFLFDRCIVCIICSLMWLCLHSLVSLWHLSEFLWSIHHPNHYQPKQCTTNYELWYTKETPGNYHIYTCIKFHAPAKLCNLTIPVFFRKKTTDFAEPKRLVHGQGLHDVPSLKRLLFF